MIEINSLHRKHLEELKYPAPRTVSKLIDQVNTREHAFGDRNINIRFRSSYSRCLHATPVGTLRLRSLSIHNGFILHAMKYLIVRE